MFGAVVSKEGCDRPSCGKDRDDEEDEDIVWRQGVMSCVDIDEVGEHAEGWDQCNDFHESPKGEEDSEKHLETRF